MLMNELSGFVVLAVIGGSLVAVALYVLREPIRDCFKGCYYRGGQIRCVSSTRLIKMLTKRNIDLKHYLYDQPASDIRKQIRNCKHCRSVDQCNDYLNNKDMDVDTTFCANNGFIEELKRLQENPSVYNP